MPPKSTPKSKSKSNQDPHFKPGSKVEIMSDDVGFRGSFYTGTIVKATRTPKFTVQYDKMFEDEEGKKPLKETVNEFQIRPIAPREKKREFKLSEEVDAYHNDGWWEGVITEVNENGKFAVFFRSTKEQIEFVEEDLRLHREWVNGEWKPPMEREEENEEKQEVKEVKEKGNEVGFGLSWTLNLWCVAFGFFEKQGSKKRKKLFEGEEKEATKAVERRVNKLMILVNGFEWFLGFIDEQRGAQWDWERDFLLYTVGIAGKSFLMSCYSVFNDPFNLFCVFCLLRKVANTAQVKPIESPKDVTFSKGMLVEVSSDEDGFKGAWFAATIVEPVGKDTFLIEYKSLRTEDDSDFLREVVDILHIRPAPPETIIVDRFKKLEEVDALYNDAWWVGVVTKVNTYPKYVVYFKDSSEELEFQHSDLRPHQDWINGKWVTPSHFLDQDKNSELQFLDQDKNSELQCLDQN
ncbi:unnamed protein product [Dovyalis caffra]|uniref:Agenet domain-containing protein n=1 Tax=Dovyalis caffra TaxID=77055 RepID=A0AAV1RY67_9ROSI|nr:unnamed protein product [Dovyalis caffra]